MPGRTVRQLHDAVRPSFDLPEEFCTAAYFDPQAPTVAVSHVGSVRGRLMALEGRPTELRVICAGELEPVAFGRGDICGLVNLNSIHMGLALHPDDIKEPHEELDHRRVAVDEYHPIAARSTRLVLGPLAPVGNCAGDQQFTIGDLADLARRAGGKGDRSRPGEWCMKDHLAIYYDIKR
jgi:hypothetical protein